MNQLTQKIQSLKEIIKDLQSLKSNQEAETISLLLKMMSEMFEEVDQRLTEIENDRNKN
jgi:hypothetical protein